MTDTPKLETLLMQAALESVGEVAAILKERFPSLTVEETLNLSGRIAKTVGLKFVRLS